MAERRGRRPVGRPKFLTRGVYSAVGDLRAHDLSPWQLDLVEAVAVDHEALIGMRGGIGSGKSAGIVFAIEATARTRPGAPLGLFMDTYRRLKDVHLPICKKVFQGARYRASDTQFEWDNGASLILRFFNGSDGAGINPIEGLNLHWSWGDECQTQTRDFLARMSDRTRVAVCDVNGELCEPGIGLSGIPIHSAWWIHEVVKAGGRTFFPKSRDNAANLGRSWFDRQRKILGDAEYQALIDNDPQPKAGGALNVWSSKSYPAGNILDGFVYDESMTVYVAIDFGRRWPAVLFIAQVGDLHVIFAECAPNEVTTYELAAAMRRVGWPRSYAHQRPANVRYLVDGGVCDPSGEAINVQTKQTEVSIIAAAPPKGFGVHCTSTTDPVKRSVAGSFIRFRRAIEERRIVCTRELWQAGLDAEPDVRTWAKCVLGLKWSPGTRSNPGTDVPLKDNVNDHHPDAGRYYGMRFLWYDHPLDGRLLAEEHQRATDADDDEPGILDDYLGDR